MLEGRHLKKTYKTKGGVEVHALDDISVIFPETGMVFLLGKSGSGKSTLLNVLGGLDKVDSGEIIIKGKNSKDFSGADFDSYRNTFIGFIFQEYNILNEFNIEQNISLALQLQGKPNDKKAVEAILEQVDLKGLGKRKPNTLSGGQKQRVAIARALIKNPEIIMADEPTGALDSNTGKQVFDTLKKLSEKKLVIVVSHDRDFAEIYADRIIELSDGKIISDVTKEHVASKVATENVSIVRENVVAIKDASKITEADLKALVNVLKNQKGEVILTSGDKDVPLVKQAIRIKDDNSSEVFNDTKEVDTKQYDGKQTKFIRSHLPAARAMKMGISSVKTKPVRMIFTTFLTTVALTMFGVASALMLFRESYSVSRALQNSHYTAEFIEKQVDVKYVQYEEDVATETVTEQYSYNSTEQGRFSKAELERLSRNGLKFAGVFGEDIYIQDRTDADTRLYNLYPKFFGFSDAGDTFINNSGFSFVAGDYPEAVDEIAITQYLYKSLQKTYNVTEESQIVGKNLKLNGSKFKITGVINVGEIPNKYSEFDKETITLNEREARELEYDFGCYMQSSFHCIGFVNEEFYEANKEALNLNPTYRYDDFYNYSYECYGIAYDFDNIPTWDIDEYSSIRIMLDDKYEDYKQSVTYYDLDGNVVNHQQLSDNATYVPYYWYKHMENEVKSELCEAARQLLVFCGHYDSYIYNLSDDQRQELLDTIERYRNYFQWEDGYPSDYDIDDDYITIKTFVDDHYANVVDKIYFLFKARSLSDTFYTRKDIEGIDETDYLPIFDMIDNIETDGPCDYTNYNEIKDFLIEDKDRVLYHYDLVRVASNNNNISSPTINEIANKYFNGEVVADSEYDYLKNFIDNLEPQKINYINYVGADRTIGYQEIETAFDFTPKTHSKVGYKSYNGEKGFLDIVGYYKGEYDDSGLLIFTKSFAKEYGKLEGTKYYSRKTSTYVEEENSIYRGAISNSNYSMEQVDVMLQDFGDHRIRMTDSTYNSIAMFVNLIATLKTIFLIIGAAFGVFAALMLLNFISSSISSKIKEIGILRAVGARGSDLFKIFFSESGFVSLICIIISIIASFFICRYLNTEIAGNLGFQMLNFGIINIGLVIAGAAVIAFVGTFIPVLIASKKPPVESIRTL